MCLFTRGVLKTVLVLCSGCTRLCASCISSGWTAHVIYVGARVVQVPAAVIPHSVCCSRRCVYVVVAGGVFAGLQQRFKHSRDGCGEFILACGLIIGTFFWHAPAAGGCVCRGWQLGHALMRLCVLQALSALCTLPHMYLVVSFGWGVQAALAGGVPASTGSKPEALQGRVVLTDCWYAHHGPEACVPLNKRLCSTKPAYVARCASRVVYTAAARRIGIGAVSLCHGRQRIRMQDWSLGPVKRRLRQ